MQSMFEAYVKSQKKAGKSKKRKKRDYNSSYSSDSEQETGYSDTGLDVDKRCGARLGGSKTCKK